MHRNQAEGRKAVSQQQIEEVATAIVELEMANEQDTSSAGQYRGNVVVDPLSEA